MNINTPKAININEYINSLNSPDQIKDLNNLINNEELKAEVSWGGRILTICNPNSNYEGSISIDKVVKKLISLSKQLNDENNVWTNNDEEADKKNKIAGYELKYKLYKFYRTTDQEVARSNPITKFFSKMRSFRFRGNSPRFEVERDNSSLAKRLHM